VKNRGIYKPFLPVQQGMFHAKNRLFHAQKRYNRGIYRGGKWYNFAHPTAHPIKKIAFFKQKISPIGNLSIGRYSGWFLYYFSGVNMCLFLIFSRSKAVSLTNMYMGKLIQDIG
jgi:hypothetical protein